MNQPHAGRHSRITGAQYQNLMPTEPSVGPGSNSHRLNTQNGNGVQIDESSFSYLPSIQGVGRSNLESGTSADIPVTRYRRHGAPYSRTGKNPLLMASYRRMQAAALENTRAGIKMVDPYRVKELIRDRSASSGNGGGSPVKSAKKTQEKDLNNSATKRVQMLRKGMDFALESSGASS